MRATLFLAVVLAAPLLSACGGDLRPETREAIDRQRMGALPGKSMESTVPVTPMGR